MRWLTSGAIGTKTVDSYGPNRATSRARGGVLQLCVHLEEAQTAERTSVTGLETMKLVAMGQWLDGPHVGSWSPGLPPVTWRAKSRSASRAEPTRNALEAMEDAGVSRSCRGSMFGTPGKAVLVRVVDAAPASAGEASVFEPFYSTKTPGPEWTPSVARLWFGRALSFSQTQMVARYSRFTLPARTSGGRMTEPTVFIMDDDGQYDSIKRLARSVGSQLRLCLRRPF